MAQSLYDYCIERDNFVLLDQWDKQKNGTLTPRDVTHGSRKKIWWQCARGHEWIAQVKSRVEGTKCPVCCNKKIVTGENDLGTTHPEIAQQWHPTKNGALTPQAVVYGTKRQVWWQCEKGHEWEARIASRTTRGEGCPVCANRIVLPGVNDLASQRPQLAAQWHPTKNGTLRPDQVAPMSNRKVWWMCEKGHEWQTSATHRLQRGTGCPYCSNFKVLPGFNDLATVEPKIAEQWHPELNGELTPQMVTAGSSKKAWWQCPAGHVWKAVISSRASGKKHGCPICSGKQVLPGYNDLASQRPDIAARWHPAKNGELSPQNIAPRSNRRVWWICEKGHEYQAIVCTQGREARKAGCPYCDGKKILIGYNDLATTQPKIAAQWYQEPNGILTPQMVTAGSNKKAWWICEKGHVWQAVVNARAGKQKSGCPVCAGKVKEPRLLRYTDIVDEARFHKK